MTAQYQVLVVGGGIIGCNILHHLALEGWSDIALCERKELTAGATWHSSGHISCYTPSPLLTDFALYMRGLLNPLIEETGQEIGLRETGSIRLAADQEAFSKFRQFVDTPVGQSANARMIGAEEAHSMWPLMEPGGFVGALHIPADCHLNAADLTQALSKSARAKGATIKRETEVTGLSLNASGDWTVETTRGVITAQNVVFATGIFARRTFKRFGIGLPSAAVSHQYLVTEPVPEVLEHQSRKGAPLPILRQPSNGMNVREEGDGLFISLYEQNAKAIWPEGPPADFGMELFPEDFDSIEHAFLDAIERVPSLGRAGIKSVVHGPMPWSPDFAPIVGPVPGHRGLWVAECASYGVIWSGGIARALARWIVHDDPGQDVSKIDCRRFGSFISDDWADQRAVRMYKGVYGSGDRPTAPNRSPLHAMLSASGAEFDEIYGTECAIRSGSDDLSTKIEECDGEIRLCQTQIHDPAPLSIFRITGPDFSSFLARTMHGELPNTSGLHTVMTRLSGRGTVDALYRVIRLAEDSFELIGATVLERKEEDILRRVIADFPHLTVENVTNDRRALIVLARDGLGPHIKNALGALDARLLRLEDLGGAEHWLSVHPADQHLTAHTVLVEGFGEDQWCYAGIADYMDIQTACSSLALGIDVHGNTRLDGTEDRSWATNEASGPGEVERVCIMTVQTGPVSALRPGALVRDSNGSSIGRLTSAVLVPIRPENAPDAHVWRAVGYISDRIVNNGSGISVCVGEETATVVGIQTPATVLPLR